MTAEPTTASRRSAEHGFVSTSFNRNRDACARACAPSSPSGDQRNRRRRSVHLEPVAEQQTIHAWQSADRSALAAVEQRARARWEYCESAALSRARHVFDDWLKHVPID